MTKETEILISGLTTMIRRGNERRAKFIAAVTKDPTYAIKWDAEGAVEAQTTMELAEFVIVELEKGTAIELIKEHLDIHLRDLLIRGGFTQGGFDGPANAFTLKATNQFVRDFPHLI